MISKNDYRDEDDAAMEGWLAQHPEDQVLVSFESVGVVNTPLFRELSFEEEQEFRQHARDNYVPGTEINEVWHPVWKDEARKINSENGYA